MKAVPVLAGRGSNATIRRLAHTPPNALALYLADVLVRLVNLWPNNRLDELLPWTWAAARQQQQRAAA